MARPALYHDGPPPAHTGGFGEPTCRVCHAGAALNDPGGDLVVAGAPTTYESGRTYELEVILRRAGMLRAGFQLAARFQGVGMVPGGAAAGVLAPADDRAAVVPHPASGVPYLGHAAAGTEVRDSAARWRFRWTAPDVVAPVVFHIAANAANDDGSPLGDFVYTRAVLLAKTRAP